MNHLLERPKVCLPLDKCKGGWDAMFWSIGQNRGDTKERELLVSYVGRRMAMIRESRGLSPCAANERDATGKTCLHWAMALNKPGVVRVLKSLGSRFDLVDNEGFSPLAWAIYAVDTQNGKGSQKLVENNAAIEQMVTLMPSIVNWTPKEGQWRNWTAIHLAIYEGRKAYLEIMLQHADLKTLRRVDQDLVKADVALGALNFTKMMQATDDTRAQAARQAVCVAYIKKEKERRSTWIKREREEVEESGEPAAKKFAHIPQRRHTRPMQPEMWPTDVVYTRHMVFPPDVKEMNQKRTNIESGGRPVPDAVLRGLWYAW